jgi:hypothetical protein
MRVHPNQIDPNIQLNALYAADRSAANREAANTRKKLQEFASKVAGESDSEEACVVRLGAHEESQEHAKRQNPQKQGGWKKPEEQANSEDSDTSVSDWA